MDQLPNPTWKLYFGVSAKQNKIVIAPSEAELQLKAKEFNLSPKATFGKIGKIGNVSIHDILQGKITPSKLDKIKETIGYWPTSNWNEVAEKGLKHPIFLPHQGCFGFLNGHLILGNRHHQEVMFRLINDKGWTWEQLMNAKQVWGWYHVAGDKATVNFSSDAGTMTSKKVKEECLQEFSDWYGKTFIESSGYGGKSKATYGGDFNSKYGEPGKWNGHKASYDNTIITPLPDPPTSEESNVPSD
jgi:hypothetical protein